MRFKKQHYVLAENDLSKILVDKKFQMKVKSESEDYYLGFRFLRSLGILFPLMYPTLLEWCPLLTGLLFVVNVSNEWVAYHSGKIVGDFYTDLLNHDEHQFWITFYKASLLYVWQTLLLATGQFVSWLLAVSMRNNLTKSLHKLYYQKKVYYQVNCIDNDGIDNPDQRITQDAEKMTRMMANLFSYVIISPIVIGFYTWKTWAVAGGIGCACIYGYFLVGTIVNRFIVAPITKYAARTEKTEGDFRYKHVSVRDHAEESAFYDAETFDHAESNRLFDLLLRNQIIAACWKYPAQYFQTFFDYYGAIMTYLVQVIPIFIMNSYKDMSPADLAGQISKNAFVFIYLINSFTRLTDLAMQIGEMAGYSQRIADLVTFSRKADDNRTSTVSEEPKKDDSDEKSNSANPLFSFEGLYYSPPNDSKGHLVANMTLDVPRAKSLLITGASGVGKTSLLRILKELWAPKLGKMSRFVSYTDMIFLPQRCYFPVGKLSLRSQLLFPGNADTWDGPVDNTRIVEVLESVSLSRLLALCGSIEEPVDFEWQEVLSPGEQQRLSMARVLLRKPKIVIMDESTSSLSLDMEKTIYGLLRKAGIHYISAGHRASLVEHHELQLKINGSHDWKLVEIDSASF